LTRLLWLRGEGRARDARPLLSAVSAVGTLLGSGLFEAVVLDLAGVSAARRQRLPGATWIRLQRLVEDQPTALVLLADGHVAHGPTPPRPAAPPPPAWPWPGLAWPLWCARAGAKASPSWPRARRRPCWRRCRWTCSTSTRTAATCSTAGGCARWATWAPCPRA